MIGTFGWLSFASSISNAKQVEAEIGLGSLNIVGSKLWNFTKGVGSAGYAVATGDWGKIADATIGQMLSWIAHFIWYISAQIFTFSGYLLDYAVDFSVKDFKAHIEQISVIDIGYKIVLNVANMLFIFILLYIAIKTILGVGGDTKKLLTNIIIVGLLINFSLFMTKVIIDASNIVAMGFYNGIQTEAGKTEEGQTIIAQGSIATAMMAGLKLQTMIPSADSEYNKEDPSKGLTNFNIMINYLGGSAMFLVSAFVFLSVALLFIVRFVALLFYMLFSPVAFLGMISPELKEYSSKWWKGLQSQALFAPAFLFLAYIVSAIVNSGQLWAAVGGDKDKASKVYDVISSTGQVGGFGIIMNYVILTALMIGALITAKEMAGKGSAGVMKYANKFQGWAQGVAGRNTFGRAAYLAGNNKYMSKLMTKSPTVGNFVKSQFDNVAGQKFGSKIGYEASLKKSIDKKKKMGEFVDKYSSKETDNEMQKEEDLIGKKTASIIKQEKIINKAKADYDRLKDKASETKNTADIDIADLAGETLQREEAMLEDLNYEIKKSNEKIEELKSKKELIQNRTKKIYAKNLKFANWGLGPLDKIFPSGADAAAEIRKGKKSAKKLMEEVLKETGELPKKEEGAEEKKEEKGK